MARSNYKKSTRGRPQFKGKARYDKSSEEVADKKTKVKENDSSWYTVSGQLVKDVANLSFNNPAGIVYNLQEATSSTFVNPGVMNLYMAPVPGYSEGLSSPINIAAKNIYSWVRHENSGHVNYDSPDLMLYINAMASAYSYYGWLTRLYGMMRVYTQTNRYYGLNLVTACGVNATSLLENMANFRAYINQYALKLSALCVPATMSLFKRYMWMFSNIFCDEDDTKAQIYMYQPAYFYRYEEYSGSGRCIPVPLTLNDAGDDVHASLSYGDLRAYGDTLIGSLIGSEDINIMSGDILKAYGRENIWKLEMIPEDFATVPVFSEEVLSQIHNTTFAGFAPLKDTTSAAAANRGWDSFSLLQDPSIGTGCIICKPLVSRGGSVQAKHVLDFWKKEVSPEDIIVATRNMVSGARWAQGFTALTAFGSEIPMFASVWNLDANGNMSYIFMFHTDSKADFDAQFTHGSDGVARLSKLSYFNQHPFMYLGTYDNSASPYFVIDAASSNGEMSNFTIVDYTDLEKMHLTAILSELAVPLIGNIAK